MAGLPWHGGARGMAASPLRATEIRKKRQALALLQEPKRSENGGRTKIKLFLH